MDVPALVERRLDDETVLTRVPLGGDDAVFVTPARTIVYRAEGLLSDESVATYPHDIERLDVKEGRRKSTFELTYVDDTGSFTVPGDRVGDVLEPVLGGALRTADVLEPDEDVREAYRFSELTLVVADGRLLKHIGSAFWDDDYEMFPFADVTDLDAEEGSVATGIVIEVDGRPERMKVPNDEAPLVRRTLEEAVLSFHEVGSVAELREKQGVADDDGGDDAETFAESGISPLVGESEGAPTAPDDATGGEAEGSTAGADDAGAGSGSQDGGGATAAGNATTEQGDASTTESGATDDGDDEDDPFVSAAEAERMREEDATGGTSSDEADLGTVLERLEALETTVEHQSARIEQQQETIEQLVEELRRGR